MANGEAKGDPVYALEKLEHVLYLLATEYGNLKDRLFEAFKVLSAVSVNDFPEALRPQWQTIRDDLTKTPAKYGREGNLCATLRSMRKRKAADIAVRICDLTVRLRSHVNDEQ